jgi:dipeptidyl aminopeptidase/acylaminoacyl peptidase
MSLTHHLRRGQDEEVPVSQALIFAGKLNGLRKPYDLIVYGDDVHEAIRNRRDRDSRIVSWFKRFYVESVYRSPTNKCF